MIEINNKCLSRWYVTTTKIHKYQPEESSLFWRGCRIRANKGTYMVSKNVGDLAGGYTTDTGSYCNKYA